MEILKETSNLIHLLTQKFKSSALKPTKAKPFGALMLSRNFLLRPFFQMDWNKRF